ncbi:MAG: hypothetical protein ACP5OC_00585 [Thermoplasmata archaeon]
MRFSNTKWFWNTKNASIYWILVFLAFGPFLFLIHSNQYVGSIIFAENPFAYFMLNGLTVATLALGFMYMIDLIVKRRSASRQV